MDNDPYGCMAIIGGIIGFVVLCIVVDALIPVIAALVVLAVVGRMIAALFDDS